jgi:hypothetical protein
MSQDAWIGFTGGLIVALLPVVIVSHEGDLAIVLVIATAFCMIGYVLAKRRATRSR